MKYRLLWVDDEIDLLKPHIYFLQEKGYTVMPINNGRDAVELFEKDNFDIVFLDENMPGISGLETLQLMKEINPLTPIIMITKSEEENIMNQAIGAKIADYLIKPVNPNQILLTLKKNLHHKEIITQSTNLSYQQEFRNIAMQINDSYAFTDWVEVYKKLSYWELTLEEGDPAMRELLEAQRVEANNEFGKFIKKNYLRWLDDTDNRPLMSPDLFKKRIFPLLDQGEKVFFVIIDNFRYDQWKSIQPLLADYFTFDEDLYCSILPTATQYARNSIFSGLMPVQIQKLFPDLWVDEEEEEGKNLNEKPMIQTLMDRFRKKYTFSYNKINESQYGEKVINQMNQLSQYPLNVVVVNFVDMLSHAKTDSKMIKELVTSESAYRELTRTWFKHSSTLDLFKTIAEKGYKIVLTTDHGTIHVNNPVKVIGDKNTNPNLRYKVGKNLNYNHKEVFEIKNPEQAGLPSPNVSSTYIFAYGNDFFAYPNNYAHYVNYYEDTYQHGGISMEEMLIPIITLDPK